MNVGPASQPTDFALDILGRYVCNTFDEALANSDPAQLPPRSDMRPFDFIVGGGTGTGADPCFARLQGYRCAGHDRKHPPGSAFVWRRRTPWLEPDGPPAVQHRLPDAARGTHSPLAYNQSPQSSALLVKGKHNFKRSDRTDDGTVGHFHFQITASGLGNTDTNSEAELF